MNKLLTTLAGLMAFAALLVGVQAATGRLPVQDEMQNQDGEQASASSQAESSEASAPSKSKQEPAAAPPAETADTVDAKTVVIEVPTVRQTQAESVRRIRWGNAASGAIAPSVLEVGKVGSQTESRRFVLPQLPAVKAKGWTIQVPDSAPVVVPDAGQHFATTQQARASKTSQAMQQLAQATTDEETQAAQDELRQALEEEYDKALAAYEKKLDDMEQRMQALRDEVSKRRDARDELVELRLKMLTYEAQGLPWPGQSASRSNFSGYNLPGGRGRVLQYAPPTNYLETNSSSSETKKDTDEANPLTPDK